MELRGILFLQMSGKVVALHRKPEAGKLEAVSELIAESQKGFVGDRCWGSEHRQVLFTTTETLEELGFKPGDLREQITTDIAGLQSLPMGTKVIVGEVEFQLTADCTPCAKMAARFGEEAASFKARTDKKRGILAIVLTSGTIRVGDEVQIVSA